MYSLSCHSFVVHEAKLTCIWLYVYVDDSNELSAVQQPDQYYSFKE